MSDKHQWYHLIAEQDRRGARFHMARSAPDLAHLGEHPRLAKAHVLRHLARHGVAVRTPVRRGPQSGGLTVGGVVLRGCRPTRILRRSV